MIPPLICYTTFNKLGMTVKGLPSYLNTNQDFEMYIVDNDSRDRTWDYIQSLKDPRIIGKKRFDKNYGALNSINWTLTHRKKGQSFINIEYDACNLTPNFAETFERVAIEFDVGFVHAHYLKDTKARHYNIEWSNYLYFCPIEAPKCPPMSFGYVPSTTLDKLGYLCEASYFGDLEFMRRVRQGLQKRVGITFSVQAIHIKDKTDRQYAGEGYDCEICHKHQNVCRRTDLWCATYYPGDAKSGHRVYPRLARYNREVREAVVQKRASGQLPLYCGTYHLGSLEPWEEDLRKDNYEFVAKYYETYLREYVINTNDALSTVETISIQGDQGEAGFQGIQGVGDISKVQNEQETVSVNNTQNVVETTDNQSAVNSNNSQDTTGIDIDNAQIKAANIQDIASEAK